jgi:hypothetical protein
MVMSVTMDCIVQYGMGNEIIMIFFSIILITILFYWGFKIHWFIIKWSFYIAFSPFIIIYKLIK